MTPTELKYKTRDSESFFFTHKTMKFFGDTIKNYGVKSAIINTYTDKNLEVWELYRKRPVKHGLSDSAYFRKDNFERTYKEREE